MCVCVHSFLLPGGDDFVPFSRYTQPCEDPLFLKRTKAVSYRGTTCVRVRFKIKV